MSSVKFTGEELDDLETGPLVPPPEPEGPYAVTLVPPEHLERVWMLAADRLEAAVERSRGRWSMDALLAALQQEMYHLWVVFDDEGSFDGVAVTQIVSYPNRRMLAIQFLGGDNFADWVWLILDTFDRFALDTGCEGIEATGRAGFWKWLEKDGYERAYTVFEKRFAP